jgi:uncharacterized membrane protein YecN with MAPEG domain
MLPITSLLTAIFALMMIALSLLVSLRRRKLWVVYGDGDDDSLRSRIRAHGNFIEYAPLALFVVGLLEFRGTPNIVIGALAFGFLCARLLHAFGMFYGKGPGARAIGMLVQHACFAIAALYLLGEMSGLI